MKALAALWEWLMSAPPPPEETDEEWWNRLW